MAATSQSRPQPNAPAPVLLVSPFPEDHTFLLSIFETRHWRIHQARSYREALLSLMRDRMVLVICEAQLPDGDWKDVLSQTEVLPDPPCLIVATRLADERLWAEVLNLGGYDLLAKPFECEEVARVSELAVLEFNREAERRLVARRKPPNAERAGDGTRRAAEAGKRR